VRRAECGHQSLEWTVLSQVNCIVHIEVAGFQILLNGFHPWSPPVSSGEAVKICFASVSSGIHAVCPNRDMRLDWTMAERWDCLVNLLASSLSTCCCQLIPSSILRHHWSSASILRTWSWSV